MYGCIEGMEPEKVTKTVLNFQKNRKTQAPWEKGRGECVIGKEDIRNEEEFGR